MKIFGFGLLAILAAVLLVAARPAQAASRLNTPGVTNLQATDDNKDKDKADKKDGNDEKTVAKDPVDGNDKPKKSPKKPHEDNGGGND